MSVRQNLENMENLQRNSDKGCHKVKKKFRRISGGDSVKQLGKIRQNLNKQSKIQTNLDGVLNTFKLY